MKMKRIMLATAALWAIAHTVACAETIQIGDGTSNTAYVPTYGWFDYSWSDSIYLKEEIGDTCVITGLSYYVTNEPYEYTMSNQRIFLLETNRASSYTSDPPFFSVLAHPRPHAKPVFAQPT